MLERTRLLLLLGPGEHWMLEKLHFVLTLRARKGILHSAGEPIRLSSANDQLVVQNFEPRMIKTVGVDLCTTYLCQDRQAHSSANVLCHHNRYFASPPRMLTSIESSPWCSAQSKLRPPERWVYLIAGYTRHKSAALRFRHCLLSTSLLRRSINLYLSEAKSMFASCLIRPKTAKSYVPRTPAWLTSMRRQSKPACNVALGF